MDITKVKQHFEAVKTYISAFQMRVDDDNVVKARNLIAFCNERIAECNKEIAEAAAKEAEEAKQESEENKE